MNPILAEQMADADCFKQDRQQNKKPSCCRIEEIKSATGGLFYVYSMRICATFTARQEERV